VLIELDNQVTCMSCAGTSVASLTGSRGTHISASSDASMPVTPLRRSAVSVRDVAGASTDPVPSRSTAFGQENNSKTLKRLSMSTSHLNAKRQLPSSDRRNVKILASTEDNIAKGDNGKQLPKIYQIG
jgi:hypothetical protein